MITAGFKLALLARDPAALPLCYMNFLVCKISHFGQKAWKECH